MEGKSWVLNPKPGAKISIAVSSKTACQPKRPSFEELRDDLETVKRQGVGRLRGQYLNALHTAAVLLDICDLGNKEPAPILTLLRQAVDLVGGGETQDSAEYLLGLAQGTSIWTLTRRRTEAAHIQNLQLDTFRKKPEQELVDSVAEHILQLLHDNSLRYVRTQIAQKVHPGDSRLTVQWVERFEAYYRMWTPICGIANDLEAATLTYLEAPAEHPPWDENDPTPYDPVRQGDRYAMQALYHYVTFRLELNRFISRYGGLWLASNAETEQQNVTSILLGPGITVVVTV